MRTSIILALCVLGVAQAYVIDDPEIKTAAHVWKEMKEYFYASKTVGEFIDALKHLDPDGYLDSIESMGDVAKEIKQKIMKLAIHEDLWGQLGDDAFNKLRELISKVLKESNVTKVKRDAGEDKKELSEDELEAVGTIIDDMEKTGASKSKVDKLNKILSQLENGSGKMKDAMDSESVKSVWKSICDKAREKNMIPQKNVPKEQKTIGYKMCSEKTYAKLQNILTKGNSAIKKIREYFTPENIELAKEGYKKIKGWISG